jgi:hypothetical protein
MSRARSKNTKVKAKHAVQVLLCAGVLEEVRGPDGGEVGYQLTELGASLQQVDGETADALIDLLFAGLVKATRRPDGEFVYQITELGIRLEADEAWDLMRRLEEALDAEH